MVEMVEYMVVVEVVALIDLPDMEVHDMLELLLISIKFFLSKDPY